MIPSDHFVMFYNEIFKYLVRQGDAVLQEYYRTISEHQATHCLKLFQEKRIPGIVEYYEMIRREENCDMDIINENNEVYKTVMHNCPSLRKVLESDGGACPVYCDHCPGWLMPLLTRCNLYYVKDVIAYDMPRCQTGIFESPDKARKFRELVLKRHPGHPELVISNF